MLKEVYKEQILKLIDFLNSDIKKKEDKIKNLEEENDSYKESLESLNANFHNNLKKLEGALGQLEELQSSYKNISSTAEKKVIELEDELSSKDKEIKEYEGKLKTLKKYNVIIWVLLFIVIILQIFLYFR